MEDLGEFPAPGEVSEAISVFDTLVHWFLHYFTAYAIGLSIRPCGVFHEVSSKIGFLVLLGVIGCPRENLSLCVERTAPVARSVVTTRRKPIAFPCRCAGDSDGLLTEWDLLPSERIG